jgi:hypothetical protein
MEKIKKIGKTPHLTEASVLNKFRININMKLPSDINPPIPSFHSATIRPARAIPHIVKIMMIRVLREVTGDPLLLFIPSSMVAIPNTRVNATSKVPVIRAVHFIPLWGFLKFMEENFVLGNSQIIPKNKLQDYGFNEYKLIPVLSLISLVTFPFVHTAMSSQTPSP